MANDQEGQVRDRIEVARADAGRLESRLRGLSDEQLAHPSACDRWTVADVAAHLAFVAQFQNRMIGRGLQGDDSVPEAARQQGPDAPPASEMIAQGALSLRERLGDGLLDTFHERYQQLFELLDSMTPDDYAKPCWHPRGDTSVADFVDLVVNELAIHGWDALSPLDADYHMAQDAVPAGLDLCSNVLARMARAEPRMLGPIRFGFELTDGQTMPDLVIGGGRSGVNATLHTDGETLILMAYGRVSMGDAISSVRLRVSGDEPLARDLGSRLTGV